MSTEGRQLIVFLGAPGSGKGSLSRMCVDNLSWVQLSTGDLCRKHLADNTMIGKQIDAALQSGTLVSDDLIITMVIEWLEEQQATGKTIIFDGFPRTVVQAEKFFDIIKSRFSDLAVSIIELQVPDQEIIQRLSSRLICSNQSCQRVYSSRNTQSAALIKTICDVCAAALVQRVDDHAETVKNRLAIYHKHAGQLKAVCSKEGFKIKEIDAQVPTLQIFNQLQQEYGSV